ncbi:MULTISPECIES: IS110 family transposase [unclassified Micromonospora]|uniref:IS110 family transposase n=1 Tax=unclassified Micromonospora TaxID=2617518 RepID=UPI002FF37EAD
MEGYAGQQFVGIDLHRRRSVIVRMTESGEVLESVRIVNDPDRLADVVARAGQTPEVVLEATYGWYWAVDALQAAGARVHLAHPLGVKALEYRRVKNDVRDAIDLADLLRMGRLAQGWIAPPATRELRELVRHRAKLVAVRSLCKAEVHAVLAKCGVQVPMTVELTDEARGHMILKLGTSRFECILVPDVGNFAARGRYRGPAHTLDRWLAELKRLAIGRRPVTLPFNFSDQCTGWLRVTRMTAWSTCKRAGACSASTISKPPSSSPRGASRPTSRRCRTRELSARWSTSSERSLPAGTSWPTVSTRTAPSPASGSAEIAERAVGERRMGSTRAV